ncbi:unnamed protein product [Linum trigynum]|uniref:Uncharacterized protein n=1 Tax=Linum trigynum TaxID=586398 RepID=A0AAV2DEQ5_9ROSI
MRGALSSLLFLCSLVGHWISRAAVEVFKSSWRNQINEDGFTEPIQETTQVRRGSGSCVGLLAVGEPRSKRVSRRRVWRRERRRCLTKRPRWSTFEETEILEERPPKRLRQKPKEIWRFWLPSSSDLDGKSPALALFAGKKLQKTEAWCERRDPLVQVFESNPIGKLLSLFAGRNLQATEVGFERPVPLNQPAQSAPFGEEISLVKSKGGNPAFCCNPSGEVIPDVSPGTMMTVSEESPPIPNGAGIMRDGGVGIADLQCRLIWPQKIRDFPSKFAPEIPVFLSEILGKQSRVNFRNCAPRRKFPIPIPTLIEKSRFILGNARARPYKSSPLLSNKSVCSERS